MSRFIGLGPPNVLGVVLFVSVLAAILSTLDAAVNTGALSLAADFFGRSGGAEEGGRSLRAGRLATVLFAAAVGLVSLRFRDVLQMLGLFSLVMAQGLFVPAAGGVAQMILNEPRLDASDWGGDGMIYFTPRGGGLQRTTALARVPETGGKPEVLAVLDRVHGRRRGGLAAGDPAGREDRAVHHRRRRHGAVAGRGENTPDE